MAFFFIVWGILNDYSAETPWITAGIGGSIVIVVSVVVREIYLRRARRRAALRQPAPADVSGKLTIELNARILKEIKKRSDAANVLAKIAAAHREVFELCREYLGRVEEELISIRSGSPRLEPILSGRKKAAKLHRFHMLRWAELEATELTLRAQSEGKAAAAGAALATVDLALESYPAERALQESRSLLGEMVVSMNVSEVMVEAERAAAGGDRKRAVSLCREALRLLEAGDVATPGRRQAAEHIRAEIEKIGQFE